MPVEVSRYSRKKSGVRASPFRGTGKNFEEEPERDPLSNYDVDAFSPEREFTVDQVIKDVGEYYHIDVDDLLSLFGPQKLEPFNTIRFKELARRLNKLGHDTYYSENRFEIFDPATREKTDVTKRDVRYPFVVVSKEIPEDLKEFIIKRTEQAGLDPDSIFRGLRKKK